MDELKPSEHACKIFFKLCVKSCFAKKEQYLQTKHACNIFGRNPSMVIPLLANLDVMPMLYEGACHALTPENLQCRVSFPVSVAEYSSTLTAYIIFFGVLE